MTLRLFGKSAAFAALAACALAVGPAGAQIQGDEPIDITADETEVAQASCLNIWRGRAEAVQGTARLRASVLSIYFKPKAGNPAAASEPGDACSGDLDRIEAAGPVWYVTPDAVARGDNGVYDADNETITLAGNVVVTRGQNVVTGDRLLVDTRTNKSTMVANGQGRTASPRVRGVFFPEEERQNRPARPAQ